MEIPDCLIFSYTKLKWIKPIEISSINIFLKLSTLNDQISFLNSFINNQSKLPQLSPSKFTYHLWRDVENHCLPLSNCILLVWYDTIFEPGHAIPVINGTLIWDFKFLPETYIINRTSQFIIQFIFYL